MNEWLLLLLVCLGAFFAGFMDAVVGGGGLIQVPLLMLLFPELSHVQIIATNRMASVAGTAVAAFQYLKAIGIDTAVVLIAGSSAAIASFSGTFVMQLIPPDVFKPMLLGVIAILAIYTFIKKDLGSTHTLKYQGSTYLLVCAGIGGAIGFYNGFIGPGTGSLLIFAFVSIAGMSFLHASASSKIVNALADGASLIGFLINKAVIFKLALPMMASNMLGAYVGSKAAILKGNAFIRYLFLVVIGLLMLRLIWDLVAEWIH
jgi:uncharacterized membrane protein YfcA